MNQSTIQFQYAFAENGEFIDITSLTSDDRKDYECIGCGKVVRPVLGEVRRNHFRHKIKHECSFETYLHRMGKMLFEKNYRECLSHNTPYHIEYNVPVLCNYCKHGPCEITDKVETYDLTKSFRYIEVEKKDGNLVPDLLLKTESGNKIYVEISVSHESTTQKINSQIKIIEFIIETEEDLHIFNSNKISISDYTVELYNFSPKPIEKDLRKHCSNNIYYFAVYPNGKCSLKTGKRYEFDQLVINNNLYIKEIEYPSGMTFVEEVEKAFFEGVKVKNCFLCRYHAVAKWFQRGDKDEPIFCKLYKKNRSSNYAAECEAYRPDSNVFKNIKKR